MSTEGILGPVARLDVWLRVVLVVLVATSAVRYVDRHGAAGSGVLVIAGAVALAAAYLARPLLRGRRWPTVWVALIVVVWTGLTVAAPSFAWCAVPVAFAVLQVVPFRPAVAIVVAMTVVVAGSWLRIAEFLDPTVIAGPIGIALVTTLAFGALDREWRMRQELLDELTDAQTELAAQQHRTGMLAERTRLSREIHDSVGQGLSSINLLLQAAEQSWGTTDARAHVHVAAATARESLDEVRRVVRDLADDARGVELAGFAGGDVPAALERAVNQAGLAVEFRVDGDPVPVRPDVATALVRTARGALANVREHARATRVAVTLTYLGDEVCLDVRDDGRGFRPELLRPDGFRGRGLRGIVQRAELLGGSAEIDSAPAEGTTVSVRFPLGDR